MSSRSSHNTVGVNSRHAPKQRSQPNMRMAGSSRSTGSVTSFPPLHARSNSLMQNGQARAIIPQSRSFCASISPKGSGIQTPTPTAVHQNPKRTINKLAEQNNSVFDGTYTVDPVTLTQHYALTKAPPISMMDPNDVRGPRVKHQQDPKSTISPPQNRGGVRRSASHESGLAPYNRGGKRKEWRQNGGSDEDRPPKDSNARNGKRKENTQLHANGKLLQRRATEQQTKTTSKKQPMRLPPLAQSTSCGYLPGQIHSTRRSRDTS